ncbi:MAG: hypothetical protein MUO73_05610 [Thermoplasmata archaeon]|nr:hypothetical protein [Thermoplasmata archaeon]
MILSHVPNARNPDVQRTTRKPTGKSEQAKSGKLLEPPSLPPTLPAVRAEIQVKCRTISPSKFTGGWNTLNFQIQSHTVPLATEVFIRGDFNAQFAGKFAQNKKILSAITALGDLIENELSTEKNTGTGSEMQKRSNGDNGLKSG